MQRGAAPLPPTWPQLKCVSFLARVRPEVMREARASQVLPAPLPNTAAAPSGAQGGGGSSGTDAGVHHLLPPIVVRVWCSCSQQLLGVACRSARV